MAVYVDKMRGCTPRRGWPWSESCHMFADTVEELHAMARKLALKRNWFQWSPGKLPHYDLTSGKRWQALRQGAMTASDAMLMHHVRKWRERSAG